MPFFLFFFFFFFVFVGNGNSQCHWIIKFSPSLSFICNYITLCASRWYTKARTKVSLEQGVLLQFLPSKSTFMQVHAGIHVGQRVR